MPLTTSYFAVAQRLQGRKISIVRFNNPRMRGSIDEILEDFAPSAGLLMDYKNKKISWSEYVTRYTQEQRDHYRRKPEDFESLLERAEHENIVLLCYERFEGSNTRCHRFLLYEMLKKVARKGDIDVEFVDENPPISIRR